MDIDEIGEDDYNHPLIENTLGSNDLLLCKETFDLFSVSCALILAPRPNRYNHTSRRSLEAYLDESKRIE